MKIFFLMAAILAGFTVPGQEPADTSIREQELEEVVISANRFAEKRKNIAQQISVISNRQISTMNAQNTGDLLMNSGKVFVQKSQQGGSSPVIRGFEASRILIVVDGVRLNNAMYRAGHLQNIITVDQNMLERVEVLYGPASTIYGSDALGGVIHLRTRMPSLSKGKISFSGNAFARYSSANNERTLHGDMSVAGKKLASLTSFTVSDFSDMKMGSHDHKDYPGFGRRTFYVQRLNNQDVIVTNEDDRVQRFSGYKQWDLLQKFLFKPSDHITHSLNFQVSSSGNIPRYDRSTDIRNGQPRYAEWYYGPQNRSLIAYEFNAQELKAFFQEARITANYQHIRESRHQRGFGSVMLDNRKEDLGVFALSLDARRKWKNHEWNIGSDAQWNDLNSTAFRKDINSGSTSKLDSRYPDGVNYMNYAGVYAQHTWKIKPDKFIINDGIRLQYVYLRSTIIDTATQLDLPIHEMKQENIAVTGNLGIIFLPDNQSKISLSLASGFRAPNIDDLARIFESSPQSRQLIIPNPDLKPEYTYSIDLSLNRTFAGKYSFGFNGFVTWMNNAIGLAPFQYKGTDSIWYDGTLSAVLANQNHRRAILYGTGFESRLRINNAISIDANMQYTYGRYRSASKNIPMDHIPPLYGRIGALFQQDKFEFQFYALYNGWKHLNDYNPDGEDNLQYATKDGMPAWFTLNAKGQYRFNKYLLLQAGLENILDRNYRPFASGFSAAGRNLVLTIRAGW